jgi:hypothetical protein
VSSYHMLNIRMFWKADDDFMFSKSSRRTRPWRWALLSGANSREKPHSILIPHRIVTLNPHYRTCRLIMYLSRCSVIVSSPYIMSPIKDSHTIISCFRNFNHDVLAKTIGCMSWRPSAVSAKLISVMAVVI